MAHKHNTTHRQSNTLFNKVKWDQLPHWIALIVMMATILFLNSGLSFKGLVPMPSDSMQWQGSAQQIIDYNKTHKDQALWTDNMFSGMPAYMISFKQSIPFTTEFLSIFSHILDWRVVYLLFGAFGTYLLMIGLGFSRSIALFSGLGFALSCHFTGLMEIGHNTKFRAIMYIPWIYWAISQLQQKRNLLYLGFFTALIIGQLRENHPQISYYTYIILGIFWVGHLIASIKQKAISKHAIFTLLLIVALVLTFLAVSYPYLVNLEYGHYTIRGGEQGLTKEYATGWSLGLGEIMSFVIPNFYGGISPYYFGDMPFNQVYFYMGIIILLLALLAVFYVRQLNVYILSIASVISVLIAYGKNLPFLSDFLLNYLPMFNKFRVPSMALVIIEFAIVVLACYGLQYVIEQKKAGNKKFSKQISMILYVCIGIFFITLLSKSAIGNMTLMSTQDMQQYTEAQRAQLHEMRVDLIYTSAIQSLLILIIGLTFIYSYTRKSMRTRAFLLLITILSVVDLALIDKGFLKEENLVTKDQIQTNFQRNGVDDFLLQDKTVYRIMPLGDQFNQTRWSYYHQSIGGYHAAKLKRYQEIIENCLNKEIYPHIPLNWNILSMLNVKYLIFNNEIPLPNLKTVYKDPSSGLVVHEYLSTLPRAWFAQKAETIQEPKKIFARLNDVTFNPAINVITEQPVQVEAPTQSNIQMQSRTIHESTWTVNTDKKALMVVSEVYYPAGWNVYIDDQKSEILPVDYILRGVIVPAGTHKIEMKFEPVMYAKSHMYSNIGLSLTLLILAGGIVIWFIQRKKKDVDSATN